MPMLTFNWETCLQVRVNQPVRVVSSKRNFFLSRLSIPLSSVEKCNCVWDEKNISRIKKGRKSIVAGYNTFLLKFRKIVHKSFKIFV